MATSRTISVIRKPVKGTLVSNVLRCSSGGLNIEATRISGGMDDTPESWAKKGAGGKAGANGFAGQFNQALKDAYARGDVPLPSGRWPANLLLNSKSAATLDAQTGYQKSGVAVGAYASAGSIYGGGRGLISQEKGTEKLGHGDSGGGSRFFRVFE